METLLSTLEAKWLYYVECGRGREAHGVRASIFIVKAWIANTKKAVEYLNTDMSQLDIPL